MNEKEIPQPALDALVQSRELQMMKAAVPYIRESQQKYFSMMIKMIELQKTMQLFDGEPAMQAQELHVCSDESSPERMRGMLNAMRAYCTRKEQENIDNLLGALEMFSSYEMLFGQI